MRAYGMAGHVIRRLHQISTQVFAKRMQDSRNVVYGRVTSGGVVFHHVARFPTSMNNMTSHPIMRPRGVAD